MYLKVFPLLSVIITLLIPSKIFALDSCGLHVNYELKLSEVEKNTLLKLSKKDSGIVIIEHDDGPKIFSTYRAKVDTDLKENFIRSLYKAEAGARINILRFANSVITNGRVYNPDTLSDGNSLDRDLKSMVTISKCHIGKKYVQVVVELSPRTTLSAK